MKKIEEMVKKLGGSPEMAVALLSEMNAYVDGERKKLDEEFRGKFVKAKQACVEEVTKYKTDLTNKLEIWLEARNATISREMKKQAAIGESGAIRVLQDVRRLIEGIEVEHPSSQAAKDAHKLRAKIAQLQEEKEAEVKAKKRAYDLSSKLLEHNKKLQRQINEDPSNETEEMKEQEFSPIPQTTREPTPETQVIDQKETEQGEAEMEGEGNEEVSQIAAGLNAEPAYIR